MKSQQKRLRGIGFVGSRARLCVHLRDLFRFCRINCKEQKKKLFYDSMERIVFVCLDILF